jgi:hypothetical protein
MLYSDNDVSWLADALMALTLAVLQVGCCQHCSERERIPISHNC